MKYDFRFSIINGLFSKKSKYIDRLNRVISNFSYDDDEEKKGSGLGGKLLTAGLGAAAGYAAAKSGIFNGGDNQPPTNTGNTASPQTQSNPPTASNQQNVSQGTQITSKVDSPKPAAPSTVSQSKPAATNSPQNNTQGTPSQLKPNVPKPEPKVESPKPQTKVNSPSAPKPNK